MPSATDAVNKKGGESIPLLTGKVLYDQRPKLNEITVRFREVRDPGEQFFSPLIADLDKPVCGDYAAVPLNKTNINVLVDLSGTDDYSKWTGATVTFERVLTNNPKTKSQTMGLLVTNYKGAGAKKTKSSDSA